MATPNPYIAAPIAPAATPAADWGTGGAITPADPSGSTNVHSPTRRIWVGGAGNIKMRINGVAVTLNSVPVGWLDVCCTAVYSTSTTATNMVAFNS